MGVHTARQAEKHMHTHTHIQTHTLLCQEIISTHMSQARGWVSDSSSLFFFIFKCAWERVRECARWVWLSLPASRAHLGLRLPSLSISDRQRATFLNHSASDTLRLGVEECGGRAEGGILHCKPSPDSRLFWQLQPQSKCLPDAHTLHCIHTHTFSHSRELSLFLAAVKADVCFGDEFSGHMNMFSVGLIDG